METGKTKLQTKDEILTVLGPQDRELRRLEKKLRVSIYVNYNLLSEGCSLVVKGGAGNVKKAMAYIDSKLNEIRRPEIPRLENSRPPDKVPEDAVYRTEYGEWIYPRSPNQKKYVNAIFKKDMVVSIGPAGTGKTFLAVACALESLRKGEIRKIVITRPIVEAGEKLGFLPGDIYEKVHPYLRPLYDAFYHLLGPEKFRVLRDDSIVEILPLAYMRGRTLENSFIILDEAQNSAPEQMKMFLTRMGIFSKIVVTGDITQIDLPNKDKSGLLKIIDILKSLKNISFVRFVREDIVRHPLVKEIIEAYEKWEKTEGKRQKA